MKMSGCLLVLPVLAVAILFAGVAYGQEASTPTVGNPARLRAGYTTDARLNDPPNRPSIEGPYGGTPHDRIVIGTFVEDPDNDSVFVKFYYDLSDTTRCSDWLGPFPSGFYVHDTVQYQQVGDYRMVAFARDVQGLVSDSSPIKPIYIRTEAVGWSYYSDWAGLFFSPGIIPGAGAVAVFAVSDCESLYKFEDDGTTIPRVFVGALPDSWICSTDAPSISTDLQRLYVPGDDSRLHCLSTSDLHGLFSSSRDTLWWDFTTPAVYGNILYAGYGHSLLCLEDNGSSFVSQWAYDAQSEIVFPPVISSDGTRIFFSDDAEQFLCLDNSGNLRWKCSLGRWVICAAAIANDVVYVGRDDGRLYGYPLDDSAPVFSTRPRLDNVVGCPVINSDGIVFAAYEDGAVAAYPGLGLNLEPIWCETLADAWIGSAPCLAPDTTILIHGEGPIGDFLAALDQSDGSLAWSLPLPYLKKRPRSRFSSDIYSSPTIAGQTQRIYVGMDEDPHFYAITVDKPSYSLGLPQAPWPKWQHDLRNSGCAGGTGVSESPRPASRPATARISSIRPNPFGERTAISYQVTSPGPVSLVVYDVSGRLLAQLAEGHSSQIGEHTVSWTGTDSRGRRLPPGIYICRLSAAGWAVSEKLLRLK
jgi:outer membrane protein assembly factor BamB